MLMAGLFRSKMLERFEPASAKNNQSCRPLVRAHMERLSLDLASLEKLDLVPQLVNDNICTLLRRLRSTRESDWSALVIAACVLEPWEIPNLNFHLKNFLDDFPLFLPLLLRRRVVVRRQEEYYLFARIAQKCFQLFVDEFGTRSGQEQVTWCNAMRSVVNTGFMYSAEFNLKPYMRCKGQVVELLAAFDSGMPLDGGSGGPAATGSTLFIFDTDAESTENLTAVKFTQRLALSSRECYYLVLHSTTPEGRVRSALEAISGRLDRPNGGLAPLVELVRRKQVETVFFANNLSFGYSQLIALAAHRIGARQITNYASVTTTGLSNVDKFVSGALSEPSGAKRHYAEALDLFEGSGLKFEGLTDKVKSAQEFEASVMRRANRRHVRFIVGANVFKCSPLFTQALMRILARVPGSRCVFYPYNPNWKPNYPAKTKFRARLNSEARAAGVHPSRLVFVGPYARPESIFAPLMQSDIFLDSFPHSGGLSTLDGLIAGLPVITLRGRFQRSMQGADVIGLSGCHRSIIAPNVDAYCDAAVCLGLQLCSRPVESRATPPDSDFVRPFQDDLNWLTSI
jgi:hypothetical protein